MNYSSIKKTNARLLPITRALPHVLATKYINFQNQMLQEIKIKYFNEALQIAMVNWREVYLLNPHPIKLNVETDKGRLVYRAKGSAKRISYKTLKKGLKKKTFSIFEEVPGWL